MKGVKLLGIFAVFLIVTMLIVYFAPEEPSDVTIKVTTEQFKFSPNIINVTFGVTVTLRITSLDVTHGFQLEEFDLYNIVVPAGETVDVTFNANKRGAFYFYCTVLCGLGHSDHLGTLIVE